MTDAVNEPSRRRDEHAGSVKDQNTLAKYVAGDDEAFAEIDRWIRAVLTRKYPRLALDFDDLSQTVHERLLDNAQRDGFSVRSSLRAYVLGILHYTTLERLRELYRQDVVDRRIDPDETAGTHNPYRQTRVRDRESLAHRVVHALPERCRQLWRLIYWEELSYSAVATRLGIPPGTVKSRMWHCRRKALKLFRKLGDAAGPIRNTDA